MAPVPPPISSRELNNLLEDLSDAAGRYNPDPDPEGFKSRNVIIMKAKEIMLSLTDPVDIVGVHMANMTELVAIRTLLDLDVFRHIPSSGSTSSHELSRATGVQEALLSRLLRLLASTGFISQLDNLEFAHTKFSAAYAVMPGPGAMFQLVYDESFLNIVRFHEYLREKGLKEPEDQRYSPYAWTAKQEGKRIWEIMEQHPQRFQAFQMGLAHADAAIPTTGYYDFGKLNTADERPILVDVGGGGGQAVVKILEAHPELPPSKFILQDLPGPIARAEASNFLPKEVIKMAHDFETPQPVKGAKAYYIRRVLHDYSDAVCTHLLKQIVPAMSHDSVVLISDFVVPERVTPADLPVTTMDITIFNMGGKERTVECFKQILAAAGLEFVTVHFPFMGAIGLVEGRLPQTRQ